MVALQRFIVFYSSSFLMYISFFSSPFFVEKANVDAAFTAALNCKVLVEGKADNGGAAPAILLYYGPTAKSKGVKRCGVEFLEDGIGKHDGSVNGKRYFQCTRGRGALVSAAAVVIENTSDLRKYREEDLPSKKKARAAKRAAKASTMATGAVGQTEADLLSRLAKAKAARKGGKGTKSKKAGGTADDASAMAVALANKDKELAKLRAKLNNPDRGATTAKKKAKKGAKGARSKKTASLSKGAEDAHKRNVVAAQAVASKARSQELAMQNKLEQMRKMVAEAEAATKDALASAEAEAERKRTVEQAQLVEAATQRKMKEQMEQKAHEEIHALSKRLEEAEAAQRAAEEEAANSAAAVMAEEAEAERIASNLAEAKMRDELAAMEAKLAETLAQKEAALLDAAAAADARRAEVERAEGDANRERQMQVAIGLEAEKELARLQDKLMSAQSAKTSAELMATDQASHALDARKERAEAQLEAAGLQADPDAKQALLDETEAEILAIELERAELEMQKVAAVAAAEAHAVQERDTLQNKLARTEAARIQAEAAEAAAEASSPSPAFSSVSITPSDGGMWEGEADLLARLKVLQDEYVAKCFLLFLLSPFPF